MRRYPFLERLREMFPEMKEHPGIAERLVDAIHSAEEHGSGTFKHNRVYYTLTADFVHHCINWDCCPATCYTSYEIEPEEVPYQDCE